MDEMVDGIREEAASRGPLIMDGSQRKTVLMSIGLILATFWAARHMLHGRFGFYEDDYTLVVRAMAGDWREVQSFLSDTLGRFGGQGRPLQHSSVFLLSYLTGRLGGLAPAYWLAFSIVGLNCVLFYFLLRRLHDGNFALVGGIAYALFSADTTQAFLYHAFGLQQSLTFLLLSCLAYLSGRRSLAYFLSLGSLLSYETAYLVFLGAPLLEDLGDKAWRRRLAIHAAVVLAILGLMVGLRTLTTEGRVIGLTPQEILRVPLVHTLEGPPVALGSYLLRPVQALIGMDREVAAASLASLVAFWLAFDFLAPPPSADPRSRARLLRLAIVGGLMLALAYPLTFTVRAYAISGRDTRVHLAAIVGASMVFASVWSLFLSRPMDRSLRQASIGGLSGLFALLIGFGVVVQKDYARAWELQKEFWSSLVSQVPDLQEGNVVLIDPDGLSDTRYLDANTWNLPLVLQYVVAFPDGWARMPEVHRLLPDWRQRSLFNPLELKAVDYAWEYVVVPWDRVVLLETMEGEVGGRATQVEIEGARYLIDLPDQVDAAPFRPGFLFSELIEQSP